MTLSIPLGSALYQSGFSELRLARLLAAHGGMRRELMIRMCRFLARDTKIRRFDLRTLAWFLASNNEKTRHIIAREYYRAEWRSQAAQSQESQQEGLH